MKEKSPKNEKKKQPFMLEPGPLAKDKQIRLLFTLSIFFSLLQLKAIIDLCNVSRETCSTGDFLK